MPNITISTGRLLQVLRFSTMKRRWRKVCGRPQLRSRHERSPNRTEVTMGSHFDQLQHAILFTAECKTEMWRCNWSSCNDSGVHLALCSKHEYTVIHWKPKKPCDRNNTPRFVVIEITRPYPKCCPQRPITTLWPAASKMLSTSGGSPPPKIGTLSLHIKGNCRIRRGDAGYWNVTLATKRRQACLDVPRPTFHVEKARCDGSLKFV